MLGHDGDVHCICVCFLEISLCFSSAVRCRPAAIAWVGDRATTIPPVAVVRFSCKAAVVVWFTQQLLSFLL